MRVVISAGHGAKVPGAIGYIREHEEACRVIETVADVLRESGVEVTTYVDTVSTTQSQNLDRIVDFHNSKTRDLDISVHFNAYQTTSKPMGCEVLYVSSTGMEIADEVVDRICDASGLINRGPKKRTDLAFLNGTEEPAILIETCFVDSKADVEIYEQNYAVICGAIADAISGEDSTDPIPPTPEPPSDVLFAAAGTCSTFGGPDDTGVSPSEGLAFFYEFDDAPWLFLEKQPPGTTGLARRMDSANVFFVACRWNYDDTSKEMLGHSGQMAWVTNKKTGVGRLAHPADWGPHEAETGRAADLSEALARSLGVSTDDEVTVTYPYR